MSSYLSPQFKYYDLTYIHDKLPVGLIALTDYCHGIAEVMGSNPVQA